MNKLAKDLIVGDIFIDPKREGRRPAKVERPSGSEIEGKPRRFFTLSDWSGLGNWSAGYDADTELEIIPEWEAMEQTERNKAEHEAQRLGRI